ncbi:MULTISPECIES: right-handed parallel beta-helix repeat-containing protein [unclassified Fictibacillus]|uniref:right-handed parallel beta-helix repeat-containing protein n=1 Tax=unclassified Fictibacillus TaxID=2644029 RepID=UPI00223C9A5B|nr:MULTISPECIES: right-handed parallel beta-helix repeat-containing protein [unclassified Fictibacillus]MED2974902.1 right-handed parallel beta-helix repeat-containing protein [Fictibacillus sp. B-59209]UZJ79886.1 right-handed parallel beta-helix repeat-containing protein [Fictibacillus sp. KU28468]
MRKKAMKWIVTAALMASIILPSHAAAASPTYSVTPNSKTYKGLMMNFSTYNSYTKHYYLLRSYLEQLEKTGGGTLVLNRGTYTISNTLYVPSNVTLKLKDGVNIVKGTKTGTSVFQSAKSIFQLIRPSKSAKSSIYGEYNGEKNISFIGEGSAVIDMKYTQDGIAIIAGHNMNINVKNITFRNMQSGHFIEMDATSHATIAHNRFLDSKPSPNRNKEAINLDTPDHSTLGWSQKWSTFDRTPNQNVTIEDNEFKNLDRAVGTHKYSGGKYHDQVVIKDNTIEKTRQDAIRVMNWSNAVIEDNTIKNVADGTGSYRGILASGAIHPKFENNVIEDAARPMQFLVWRNTGPGSQYDTIYNDLNEEDINTLKTNKVKTPTEGFIRINKEYNSFTKQNTDLIPVKIMN